MASELPLSHIRVLDLTRVRAGPTCVRQLADWGADVVKIELPPDPEAAAADALGGPRHGPDFYNLHRNKRSITLNLKSDEGREIFFKLAQDADVVLFLHRKKPNDSEDPDQQDVSAEIIIGKQRNGPVGNIPVAFIPNYAMFNNFTTLDAPPEVADFAQDYELEDGVPF